MIPWEGDGRHVIPNVQSSDYWSAVTDAEISSLAWFVL
jgi:hypothetical protein